MDLNNVDMKFPIDNMESLPKSETVVISKLKLRIYFILGLVGSVVTLLTAYSPVVSNWLKSEDSQLLHKYKEDVRFQTFKDSMIAIKDLKLKRINDENREKIYHLMNELRKELPTTTNISIYYTHDSGGVPVTGSPLNVTLLYTANNSDPCLGRTYWQSRVVPQGYIHLNKRIRDEHFVYIPDVRLSKGLWTDSETKEDLECNNTKAIMGLYLKETGYAVYFITVSWDSTDPFLNNFRAKIILRKYAAEIEPLIYTKKH